MRESATNVGWVGTGQVHKASSGASLILYSTQVVHANQQYKELSVFRTAALPKVCTINRTIWAGPPTPSLGQQCWLSGYWSGAQGSWRDVTHYVYNPSCAGKFQHFDLCWFIQMLLPLVLAGLIRFLVYISLLFMAVHAPVIFFNSVQGGHSSTRQINPLTHVQKWVIIDVQNMGGFSPKTTSCPKLPPLWRFCICSDLNANIFVTKRRIERGNFQLRRAPYSPTFWWIFSNKRLRSGCEFWLTVTVIACVVTWKSPNAIRPNFATCSQVGDLKLRVQKLGCSLLENAGSKLPIFGGFTMTLARISS